MSESPSTGRYLGGKILSALLTLAVIVVLIWYWRLPAEARGSLWSMVRTTLIWLGFVAILPWATFFVPLYILRRDSNVASAVMLISYFAVDVGASLYLGSGFPGETWSRILLVTGWLLAWAYTFVICESIANKVDRSGP